MNEARISPNQIIGSLLYRTRESLRSNPAFVEDAENSFFGANYFAFGKFNLLHMPGTIQEIKNNMFDLDKDQATRKYKFPALLNYEQKNRRSLDGIATIYFSFSFVSLTHKDWLTEERERNVFDPILRPIYREFIRQIKNAEYLKRGLYVNVPSMTEIFTTGSYANTSMVEYNDWLDAIEVRNFELNYEDCDRPIWEKVIEENNKLIEI